MKTDWFDKIFNIIQECEDIVSEVKKRKVIRKGKMVRKTFCPPGQKAKKGRCVTMKGAEKAKRKRVARRSAMKRKAKMSRILKKRKKALKKRHTMGLRKGK
tara:strand:+ start:97 stop:399 length:303 start_codon:yes stop_codon:yes gene_type:complete